MNFSTPIYERVERKDFRFKAFLNPPACVMVILYEQPGEKPLLLAQVNIMVVAAGEASEPLDMDQMQMLTKSLDAVCEQFIPQLDDLYVQTLALLAAQGEANVNKPH